MVSRAMVAPSWSDIAPLVSRGALTLGFGLVALLLQMIAIVIPGVAAALLLLVFAAFVGLDAVLMMAFLWLGRPVGARRAELLLRCILAGGMTAVTLAGPIVAGEPWGRLATLLATWAVLNGMLDLTAGWGGFGAGLQHWLIVVGGVSVAIGVVLLVAPPSGMLPLAWWIVGYGGLYGGVTLVNAWRSRS
jgi:hypothetical protein